MGHVAIGLERAGRRPEEMAYSTIALACVDRDGAEARRKARPVLASFLGEFASMNTFAAYGISDQLGAILERGGTDAVAREMPDRVARGSGARGDSRRGCGKSERLGRRGPQLGSHLLSRRIGARDPPSRGRGGHTGYRLGPLSRVRSGDDPHGAASSVWSGRSFDDSPTSSSYEPVTTRQLFVPVAAFQLSVPRKS